MSYWRLLLLACGLAFLGACASPQVTSLQQRAPANLAMRAAIPDIPFYAQEDYQCGPAALAMVASAAGVPLKPEDLVEHVYLPARQGSLQQEMMATARRYGLLAYQIDPHVEGLLREIEAGNPVVVLQNLGLQAMPKWHYAVAIGYDRPRNKMILHSGLTERMEMSLFTFEHTWARSGYWGMLVMQPDQLPATVQADRFVAAASALERTHPKAAETAYRTALKTWPAHPTAWLGIGNTAYTEGELDAALEAYQTLVALHPDFADGWNNLAQVLFEKGRMEEASSAITRAISLGGSRLPRYHELQQEIEVGMQPVRS
jgi:tetratricopeptide (TPR) repeat protein